MNPNFTIGIDLMGADVPPSYILEAVLAFSPSFYSDLSLVFFGTQEVFDILPTFIKNHTFPIRFELCPDVVMMDENPLKIIREKKQTSLLVGMRSLKEGSIAAFVSCANTGALVAVARSELDALPGISRPALACTIPINNGVNNNNVVMLDVGGNVEATQEMLLQFAKLGAAWAKAVYNISLPKVALLNIGQEALKGTQDLKSAILSIQEAKSALFDFVGNKEPYDVFAGSADVFVTNGFSGNLFIKTCEAVSRHILGTLTKKYPDLLLSDIISEGSGAQVLGVNKLVIKCHGAATTKAIGQALQHTKHLLTLDVVGKIQSLLSSDPF